MLLVVVVTVTIQTPPGPLHRFAPPNELTQRSPWVWMPTVLVPSALLGHVLVLRRVLGRPRETAGGS